MDGRPDLASGPLKIGKLNVLNAIFNLILKFSVDCKNVFAKGSKCKRQPWMTHIRRCVVNISIV